jgi:hypothetical protein
MTTVVCPVCCYSIFPGAHDDTIIEHRRPMTNKIANAAPDMTIAWPSSAETCACLRVQLEDLLTPETVIETCRMCDAPLRDTADPLCLSFSECESCYWTRLAARVAESHPASEPSKAQQLGLLDLTDDVLTRIVRLAASTGVHHPGCRCHVMELHTCGSLARSARVRNAAIVSTVCKHLRQVVRSQLIPALRLEGLREVSATAELLQTLNVETARFLHDVMYSAAAPPHRTRRCHDEEERALFAPAGVPIVPRLPWI